MNNLRALSDRFVTLVRQLCRSTYIARLDEWQGLDMTLPQIKTLILLEHMGPLRMGAIAGYLGSGLSTTTTIVDRLVRKHLIQRVSDPSDRRVVMCELTNGGREATELFWDHLKTRALMLSDQWDVNQLEKVVEVLELIWRTEEALQAAADTEPSNRGVSRGAKTTAL